MHGHASNFAARDLGLAGMDADANLEVDHRESVDDGGRALDGRHRLFEGSQEAIPGGVDLVAVKVPKSLPDDGVVARHEATPAMVPQPRGMLRGGHDVREQDRGQPALRGASPAQHGVMMRRCRRPHNHQEARLRSGLPGADPRLPACSVAAYSEAMTPSETRKPARRCASGRRVSCPTGASPEKQRSHSS